MPVSVSSLFPMAQPSGAAAADGLAGNGSLTSAKQAAGSFQSLLGMTQAASSIAGTPGEAAAGSGSEQAAASELATAPATPADTLAGDPALLPPMTAEAQPPTSAQQARPADAKPADSKPGEADAAPAADHIKPQVAADQPILPQLVERAASAEPTASTEPSDGAADDPSAQDDADLPAAKHDQGDAAAALALQVPVSQTQPTAAPSIQPQLAVAPPSAHGEGAAEPEAGKDNGEGSAGISGKLAKPAAAASSLAHGQAAQEPSGARSQNAAAGAGTPAERAPDQGPASSDANLSAPLFSQTLTGTASRPAALPYAPPAQSAPQSATVSVQQGQFGNDIGVEIARALDKGGDDLLIRLDPRHMGRIDVRLSFDHDGVLRAVLSADSASSLDMLRRESTDLGRALADAGIRSDGQSLRFDSRSGGQGGQRWQGEQGQRQAGIHSHGGAGDGFGGSDDPIYRPLRSSGHVDLMA
mgnify:CR=1 FL=1